MPFRGCSPLREPIDCGSSGSTRAAALSPTPLRSRFSGDLVGREFELFGKSVGNADSDTDCESDNYADTAQEYCEAIRPVIRCEVRDILCRFGGSGWIRARLSILSETDEIEALDL
jgi:hypothetical protein